MAISKLPESITWISYKEQSFQKAWLSYLYHAILWRSRLLEMALVAISLSTWGWSTCVIKGSSSDAHIATL